MDLDNVISVTEARKRIFSITKDVQKFNRFYTLTEKGLPKAVIMSADDFYSWQETLEVLRDFPDILKDVDKVKKDIVSGKYLKYKSIEDIIKE